MEKKEKQNPHFKGLRTTFIQNLKPKCTLTFNNHCVIDKNSLQTHENENETKHISNIWPIKKKKL